MSIPRVTIQGLTVPELENQIGELKDSISSLQILVDATAKAVIRVDADVQAILEVLRPE